MSACRARCSVLLAVSLGIALARDEIDPEGRSAAPTGHHGRRRRSFEPAHGHREQGRARRAPRRYPGVNEKFLVQVNYSLSDSSGYLNDPYKILSVVDPVTGEGVARAPAPGATGPLHVYRFESRPDARTKHSLFARGKYYLDGRVLDMSWRYMTDDWGIDSHTLDLKVYWPLGERNWLQPQVRFYTQTEADFYRVSLPESETPAFASADYRLAGFDAVTAGLEYGWETPSGDEVAVTLEYYRQDGDVPAGQLPEGLTREALYPGLDAIIFTLRYGFDL